MFKILFLFSLLFFIDCGEDVRQEKFTLKGKWKTEKSNSVFEKDSLEILYDFSSLDENVYSAKIIGLDNPFDDAGEIIKCPYCEETPKSLLGYSIFKNLKYNGSTYKGKMYDIYNRKWFDCKIEIIDSNTLKVRYFPYLPIFGKNIYLKRGEEFFQKLLNYKFTEYDRITPYGYYALSLGQIEKIDEHNFSINLKENLEKFNESKGYIIKEDGKLNQYINFFKFENGKNFFQSNESIVDTGETVFILKK